MCLPLAADSDARDRGDGGFGLSSEVMVSDWGFAVSWVVLYTEGLVCLPTSFLPGIHHVSLAPSP